MTDSEGPPRAVLIAALVLAVGVAGVVLAIAATRHPPPQPLAVPTVPAPHAQDPACRALLEALPQRLGDYQRAPIAQPTPPATAAWRTTIDSEPVVLRCGLDRPTDFVVGSPIQQVDRVQWFEARQSDRSTWYTVDRAGLCRAHPAVGIRPDADPAAVRLDRPHDAGGADQPVAGRLIQRRPVPRASAVSTMVATRV